MQRLVGKKQSAISSEELIKLAANYGTVSVDLGTGDGSYVLRQARSDPDRLCIGIDAAGDAMTDASRRAATKPARGGSQNAIFVVSGIEALPDSLEDIADEITIHFPWGSLLRSLVEPNPAVLDKIGRLGRHGCRFTVLINYSIFKDEAYADRLALPPLDADAFESQLGEVWKKAGLRICRCELNPEEGLDRTSWGKRLIRGAGRETLFVGGLVERRHGAA